jgi:hypothetical protein
MKTPIHESMGWRKLLTTRASIMPCLAESYARSEAFVKFEASIEQPLVRRNPPYLGRPSS